MKPDSSPLPRLTVNIGITGHRRLPVEREASLRQQVRAFLQLVQEQVEQLMQQESVRALASQLYAAEPPRYVLLSALAAGADSLVAQEALALGYELHSPLPVEREEYTRDFDTAESLATYRELLGHVTSGHLFEIVAANPERGHAYADASSVMLNHSDVLLAIWNGQDTEYIAGTSATIHQADQQHIPTVHIPIEEGAPTCMITDRCRYSNWEERLQKHIRALLLPVEALHSNESDLAFTRACMEQEHLTASDWCPRYLGLPGLFYRTEKAVSNILSWMHPHPDAPEKLAPMPGADTFVQEHPGSVARLQELFTRFDKLSNAYSVRYRSGLCWRYLAPVLAIAFLSCALYWKTWFAGVGENSQTNWLSLWFGLQGIFLLVPLVLQYLDRKKLWHRKFFSYRVVGEQLRQTMHLGPVGYLSVRERESSYSDSPQRWTAWYYRALMRHHGLPGARVDGNYLTHWLVWVRNALVVDQLNYHSKRWRREGNIGSKLIYLGVVMFGLGIAAALIRAILVIYGSPSVAMSLVSVATMVFPSLAVFFSGLCAYACYSKNQQVSLASSDELSVICREMDGYLRAAGYSVTQAEEGREAAGGLHYTHVYKLAEQVDACCKGELLEWEDLIRGRGIKGH